MPSKKTWLGIAIAGAAALAIGAFFFLRKDPKAEEAERVKVEE